MELSHIVKNFVFRKENADILVDLTKLSTEYYSYFVHNKDYNLPKEDRDYSHALIKIDHYLKKHREFRGVNPKKFSIELMKYLYEHRKR